MKPPTTEALRYAATVLGRECTALERSIEIQASASPQLRTHETEAKLGQLLAQVRSVRTWILGVEMPRAERRAPLSERIDARKRVLARIRKAAASPLGIVAEHVKDAPRYACSESWDCRCPECMEANAGNPRELEDVPGTCNDCGATLAHVVGPNVRGLVCPECNRDSTLFDDSDHEIDCRCSECGDAPIRPEDLNLLGMSAVGLIPSARDELKAISRDLKSIFGDHRCSHPNAAPAKEVPALSCPDCGAVFRKIAQ